jgi:outer membrane lipoprotein SlyB
VRRHSSAGLMLAALIALAACAQKKSPDTYSPTALQQVNKVDRGTIQSYRVVAVQKGGLGAGTLAGGAAGGIGGAQLGAGSGSAVAALGGVLIGAAIGTAIEQKATEGQAYEYIVEKANGDLMTLAQQDETPLAVGQKVLILYGIQARLIKDPAADTNSQPPAGG